MVKRFDPTLKSLVEDHPLDWLMFSGRTTQAVVEVVESDVATVSGAADKVLRVHDPIPWLLHLELQAGHDPDLQERLQWYNTLLGYRHRMAVRSVLILLRPQADSPRFTGRYRQQFPDEEPYLEFRYRVVRVWQLPAEQFLAGGPGILPLALLGAVPEESLPGVLQRMDKRFVAEVNSAARETLLTAAFLLAGLRMDQAAAAELFRGVLYMEESTTYQWILNQGKTLGIAEGEAEGKAKEARAILLRQGRKRFGPADASTTATLAAINDIERLERMSERLLDVQDWAELLATR